MNAQLVLDTQKFWDNFGDLKHLVPSLMATFVAQCPGSLERIEKAVRDRDVNALRAAAHAFKGTLFQVFADRSGKIAEELERRGRAGTLEGTEELSRELRREVELLVETIGRMDFTKAA